MTKITLQINMSPGDIRYAEQTVPALVNAHRSICDEVLLIVDCCKPQRTKILNPETRFPEPKYSDRVIRLRQIVESFQSQGLVDRIEYLEPSSSIIPKISEKYLAGLVTETHDYGGCALMSYLAAFELSTTKYLLHYDADMLLYQREEFQWPLAAIELMEKEVSCIAATPRISPPLPGLDAPSSEAWPPFENVDGGWKDFWYSTRCFLFDREKLISLLPLVQGRLRLELFLVKLLRRGFPRSPEVMLRRRLEAAKLWRLNIRTENAWLIHPQQKGDRFMEILPKILRLLPAGEFPGRQAGKPELLPDEWETFAPNSELTPTERR